MRINILLVALKVTFDPVIIKVYIGYFMNYIRNINDLERI